MDSYRVEVTHQARQEVRSLPGHMRQRVLRELKALKHKPRPYNSHELDTEKSGVRLSPGLELHRIRLTPWRIIYAIEEEWGLVTVLAVRKRPPYEYDDLDELIKDLE